MRPLAKFHACTRWVNPSCGCAAGTAGVAVEPSEGAPMGERNEMRSPQQVLASVLSSLSERLAADMRTLTAGEHPAPLSDQQIAAWQVEALALAGFRIVKVGWAEGELLSEVRAAADGVACAHPHLVAKEMERRLGGPPWTWPLPAEPTLDLLESTLGVDGPVSKKRDAQQRLCDHFVPHPDDGLCVDCGWGQKAHETATPDRSGQVTDTGSRDGEP